MVEVANILDKIVAKKRKEIAESRARTPLASVQQSAAEAPSPKDFLGALQASQGIGLIAEIKKASPSQGLIREDFDPPSIAKTYTAHGASCISVLTDETFFQGSLSYLQQVRAVVDTPLLRKEFILDTYQIYEARAAGADAVLLIAEILTATELAHFSDLAQQLGMVALIELYDPDNLPAVLATGTPLIGVNNRDLRTFEVDLGHTVRLRNQIPENILLVGESGIHSREDALYLQKHGVNAMLVGESLMREANIGSAVDRLLGSSAN
ncbi:MAG: indole-3-glycerol phosphate synthase TrpC [Planctomycetota bacterium]|nr:indole-3-glycerol phosphate synthase TrpC [Planctomycetota bacterium]